MNKSGKRERKPFIPDPQERTGLSRNLLPGEAITLDGPGAIVLKRIDSGEARLLLLLPHETISCHLEDADILFPEGHEDE